MLLVYKNISSNSELKTQFINQLTIVSIIL